ncbi:NifU family protein [Acidovorax soli]|nr:NifU family protein [Acidovorax soli]
MPWGADMAAAIDPQALQARIASVNVLVRSHAGEIELVGVAGDGRVTVRYTGMCAGCDYRPVTTAGTVEPALLDVAGVTSVAVAGPRISEAACARIGATLDQTAARERAVRIVRQIEHDNRIALP